ncbi:hypothetical protein [Vibrio alginolyticus]|uniref:DUF4875 domain-containing protein n=1 Tax=Vibrio alginolyticus TaxID=663 RepID=UPI001EED35D4|nr:hypothetical protein [Vibrio alginolyticus]ULF83361.1 hypothetical protein K6750_04525 [Vibrio alginolyticus]
MNNRKVSIWLGIGIALIPLVFSWFTLRKGYSRKSKIISFSWLFLTCLLVGISPQDNTESAAVEIEAKQADTVTPAIQPKSQDDTIESLIQTHSVSYEVTRGVRLDTGNRTRFNSNILAPNAQTYDQQLATAAKAAKELQLTNRVQVSSVNLFTKVGGVASITINFAPDNKGWSGTTDYQQRFVIE